MEQDELLLKSGFKMVMHAGDARVLVRKALDHAARFEFDSAREALAKANEELLHGHEVQTEVLQKECSGEPQGYNVLFCHGMDTLMTVKSEYELAEKLTDMMQAIIQKLEG